MAMRKAIAVILFLITSLCLLVAMYYVTLPGRGEGAMRFFIALGILALLVIEGIAYVVRAHQTNMGVYRAMRYRLHVGATIVFLLLLWPCADMGMETRFALSRAALDRFIADYRSGGVPGNSIPGFVGTYWIDDIITTREGYVLLVVGGLSLAHGFEHRCATVPHPDRQMNVLRAEKKLTECWFAVARTWYTVVPSGNLIRDGEESARSDSDSFRGRNAMSLKSAANWVRRGGLSVSGGKLEFYNTDAADLGYANHDFAGAAVTLTHDDNGNMTSDGLVSTTPAGIFD